MLDEHVADLPFHFELVAAAAVTQVSQSAADEPVDLVLQPVDHYYLNMCMAPRPERSRGCYADHWGPHRFESLGEIFIVPPGEALHIRTDVGRRHAVTVCELRADAVQPWLDGAVEWTDRRLFSLLDIANPYIRSALLRLSEEARYPAAGSETLVEHVVGQLAIEVARHCLSIAEGPIAGGLAPWRLRLIDERLQDFTSLPTLEALATMCNISVRQLTRGFRASRGSSIGDYMAHVRIEAAKRRLASDETIGTIAAALGFASPASFSSAFRRATGSGPRQFRHRRYRKRRQSSGPPVAAT
jgi:AraC family transcriptional regulator